MNAWDNASGTKSNTIPLANTNRCTRVYYDLKFEKITFIYIVIKNTFLQNKEPL